MATALPREPRGDGRRDVQLEIIQASLWSEIQDQDSLFKRLIFLPLTSINIDLH